MNSSLSLQSRYGHRRRSSPRSRWPAGGEIWAVLGANGREKVPCWIP